MTIHFQSRAGTRGFHAAGPDAVLTLACALAAPAAAFVSTFGPSKLGAGIRVIAVRCIADGSDIVAVGAGIGRGPAQPVSAARTKMEIPTARSAQRSVFRVVAIRGPRSIAYKAI